MDLGTLSGTLKLPYAKEITLALEDDLTIEAPDLPLGEILVLRIATPPSSRSLTFGTGFVTGLSNPATLSSGPSGYYALLVGTTGGAIVSTFGSY